MNYPISALPYDAGFLLFAAALLHYGIVLRPLLKIIQRSALPWVLFFAAALLLVSVALHAYAFAALLPQLDTADDVLFHTLYRRVWTVRCFSLLSLFLAGALTATSGFLYYRWINR